MLDLCHDIIHLSLLLMLILFLLYFNEASALVNWLYLISMRSLTTLHSPLSLLFDDV